MSRYQFTSGSNPSTGGSKARSGQSLMRVPGEQPPALNECSSYNVLDEDEVFEDEMSEDESEFQEEDFESEVEESAYDE